MSLCLLLSCAFCLAQEPSVSQSGPNENEEVIPAKKTGEEILKGLRRHKRTQVQLPDSAKSTTAAGGVRVVNIEGDTLTFASVDSIRGLKGFEILGPDSVATAPNLGRVRVVNPDPMRAMWLSALFPGAGQIYNRRYWKLPIIAGAFVGLTYGVAWNNRMLNDYTKAYRDVMDDDPATRSYMDLFAPTVKEETLDKSWLQNILAIYASSAWWVCICSTFWMPTWTRRWHTSTYPTTCRCVLSPLCSILAQADCRDWD